MCSKNFRIFYIAFSLRSVGWSDSETQQQIDAVQRLRFDKFTFLRCTYKLRIRQQLIDKS
ncbi:hypothetical protein CKA32_001165 [Geitlerinema sp. FC II]|nr:hypothetical protein CKA32_001165 [Geitlerinema sp. FC II]